MASGTGGGTQSPATGSGGTDTGTPPDSNSGTPPDSSFQAFGPLRITSGASSDHAPQVARLAGRRNVVAWVRDRQVLARFKDAAGMPIGDVIVVSAGSTLGAGPFSLAPAPDGGFVAAWVVEAERPVSQFHAVMALQARRYSPTGELVWEQRVNEGLLHAIDSTVVKPTADGGFVVGWTAKSIQFTAPWQAFLQRLSADGSRVGPQAAVNAAEFHQEQIALAPLQDGTVLAVWRQVVFGSRGPAHWIYTRRFDAMSAPMTQPTAVEPPFILPATQPFRLDADTLANGNVALVWAGPSPTLRLQVHTAVLSPDGALQAAAVTTDVEFPVSDVAVVPLGNQGFGAAWQEIRSGSREINAMLWMRTFDNAGAATGEPVQLNQRLTYWVSPTTGFFVDAGEGFDLYGGPDGHFIGAYHRAEEEANTYLFGR